MKNKTLSMTSSCVLASLGMRPRVPNLQPFIPKKNAQKGREEQKEPTQMETSLKPS